MDSVRRILFALLVFGIVGLGAELLLLEHVESTLQWIPIVALGAALASSVPVAFRPRRATLRIFQGVMAATAVVGLAGLVLHLRGNLEFEREMDPALRGFALFWQSLHGATPALAPAAMTQLGLLGLAYAYRHPNLTTQRKTR